MFKITSSVKTLALPSILLSISTFGAIAQHTFVFVPGKKVEFRLGRAEIAESRLSLKSYEYTSFKVIPQNVVLELKITDPHGLTVKQLTPFDQETDVNFANDIAGEYVVQIAASQRVLGRTYGSVQGENLVRIDDFHHWNATDRIKGDFNPPPESVIIGQLRKNFRVNKGVALREFWAEVKERGTPLIENVDGDPFNKRVTFVWRGNDETRNVMIKMSPFSTVKQGAYMMHRVEGTNVWFLSMLLPKDLRCLYGIAVNVPESWKNGANDVISSAGQVDPLNPHSMSLDPHYRDSSRFESASVIVMPEAPAQPWVNERVGVPKGSIQAEYVTSENLGVDEPISVYLPAGFSEMNVPKSVFILFDRAEYTTYVPTPTILDNLIADKKIPPTVAVLIEFPEPQDDNRARQLTCNPDFSKFLASELLPWLQNKYHLKVDPKQLIVGGASLGGLAATCAGLHYPDTFQNIISQSGSFWWTKEYNKHRFEKAAPADDPDRELGDVMKMVLSMPKLPLRFYMEAGSRELDAGGKGFDLLTSGRHLRDTLLAKGYEVEWHQFRGGHDFLSWRGSLADALIYFQSPARN